ncbi:MAG: hypothetical protein ACYCOU_00455 [Sulfobacillus sp.]
MKEEQPNDLPWSWIYKLLGEWGYPEGLTYELYQATEVDHKKPRPAIEGSHSRVDQLYSWLQIVGANKGITVEYSTPAELLAKRGFRVLGFYDRDQKHVVVDKTRSIKSQLLTLAHELAHVYDEATPKPRSWDVWYDSIVREVVAETVAWVILQIHSIDGTNTSITYLYRYYESREFNVAALQPRLNKHIRKIAAIMLADCAKLELSALQVVSEVPLEPQG